MENTAQETRKDQAGIEDLCPKDDVKGGANGMPRISDKNGTVAGAELLPLR